MKKTVTYLFPNFNRASNLKIFQDRTSQITGYYFTKNNVNEIKKIPNSANYGIYFLFDDSEESTKQIYVGQSSNGIERMVEHRRTKEFWTYCILFTTDNNSFDKLSIDYLEYIFINKVKGSSYSLNNSDERITKPNISIYDEANLEVFVNQIEFLLSTEGIVLKTISLESPKNVKYYEATKNCNAKLFVQDGKFVLLKGSEVKRPIESSKEWKNGSVYKRNNKKIDNFISAGKIEGNNNVYVLKTNIEFNSPSAAADLVSGYSENGWVFFKRLNDLRKNKK